MKITEISVRSGSFHPNAANGSEQDGIECTLTAELQEGASVGNSLAMLQAMADRHVRRHKEQALKKAEENVKVAMIESNVDHLKSHVAGISQAMREVEKQLEDLLNVKDEPEDADGGDGAEETEANASIEVLGEDSGADNMAADNSDMDCRESSEEWKKADPVA